MKATTIRAIASEIGVSRWAVRHAIRSGYVPVRRSAPRRKLYLQPDEVLAIKRHFGVLPAMGMSDGESEWFTK